MYFEKCSVYDIRWYCENCSSVVLFVFCLHTISRNGFYKIFVVFYK